MQQRRKCSEEFKREAFGLTRLPRANVSQIARALGIRDQAFRLKSNPPRKWGSTRPRLGGDV